MKTTQIFLASSSELKDDREQFEIFINRKNKGWEQKGIFLKLIVWEDFLDSMSQTRKQDDYNKAIAGCDIFVMLFFTKVGKYTEEEFDCAYRQFKETDKPRIFIYFKNAHITTGSADVDDLTTVRNFKKKIHELGHFEKEYENIDRLKSCFSDQLEKMLTDGFHHYLGNDNDDYEKIREKISTNRGVGTSEILQNKSINDLDNKTLEIFFSKENIKKEIAKQDQNIDHLTDKEKLYFLSLVENGYIFKGTFLCLAKFNQFQSVCYTTVETKFNLFKGVKRNAILINDTIKGNILKQYEDTIIMLQRHIPLTRNVYTRSDSYEIPFIAFKEIVTNAFVHRSYEPEIQSYIQVELFDDRLEIKSPGLFPKHLDPDNIEMSRIINPTVAAIFHLSGYIEKSGTGINRAQKEMADNGLKKIVFDQNKKQKFVKAIIYRPN